MTHIDIQVQLCRSDSSMFGSGHVVLLGMECPWESRSPGLNMTLCIAGMCPIPQSYLLSFSCMFLFISFLGGRLHLVQLRDYSGAHAMLEIKSKTSVCRA